MPTENLPFVISITIEEFTRKKIVGEEATEVIFQDKTFIEGPTFSKNNRQLAINYCQQQAQIQRYTLIVASHFFFTVWLQKLTLEESINSSSQSPNWFQINLPTTEKTDLAVKNDLHVVYPARQKGELYSAGNVKEEAVVPDKPATTIRKYRGVTYEVEITDLQPQVNHSRAKAKEVEKYFKKKTVVKTYRGISYEVETGDSKNIEKPPANPASKSTRKYRGQSY